MSSMNAFEAAAIAAMLTVGGSGSLEAANVLTMKEMQGVSFDVGKQRAVGYFLRREGRCNLVVTMAEPPHGDEQNDDVYTFTATRFEAAIPAGQTTTFDADSGGAFEFACEADAQSMSITHRNQIAAQH